VRLARPNKERGACGGCEGRGWVRVVHVARDPLVMAVACVCGNGLSQKDQREEEAVWSSSPLPPSPAAAGRGRRRRRPQAAAAASTLATGPLSPAVNHKPEALTTLLL
jgi:hypothetical protein